jgi:nonsense-mediated mRNA decay protein 3
MPRSSDSKHRIRENICPRCGAPAPDAGLCGACRAGDFRWLSCDSRVTIIACPVCGARREAGVWTDSSAERVKVEYNAVARAVHVAPEIRERSIEIGIREQSVNRSLADCKVSGLFFGEPVEESCQVEILWQKEQCDRCSRMSGSYYEGIVQVRALGRKIWPAEVEIARQIAREIEDGLFASGERLSFISDLQETKDGLDITVGSQRIGKEIASAIVNRLGGRYTTHPKLVGERAGKRLYRITYSVRLSPFARGDVVVVRGRYGEVVAADGKELRYRELPDMTQRVTSEKRVERLVGNARDAAEYQVTFIQGDSLGLLDPVTGRSIECPLPPGMTVEAGTRVRVIHDLDRIIILGRA